MRKKENEITDLESIEEIIHKAVIFRLAMTLDDNPYVVPLCFGYRAKTIFFHSAGQGKKIDILRKNNKVCFEFDVDCEPLESGKACNWSMKYRSVIGWGKVSFIEDMKEKQEALGLIMENYSENKFQFTEGMVRATLVAKIDIEQMTGKFSVD